MHRSSTPFASVVRSRRLLVALALFSTLALPLVFGQSPVPVGKPTSYPSWWFERDVIKRTNSSEETPAWPDHYREANDYAAINQGQLKRLATAAFDELESRLAPYDGAGAAITNLIKSWHELETDGSFRIVNDHRVPKITSGISADYAIVNIGQLKAVAKPFYDRLKQIHFVSDYPWTETLDDDNNYAAANIGQAKKVFSFDLMRDSDHDSIADIDEDTDGDGLPDTWELTWGLNELDSSDGEALLSNWGLGLSSLVGAVAAAAAADIDADGRPNNEDAYPKDKRRKDILPVLQYVAIDISTPIIEQKDVWDVAIDNTGQVSFAWNDGDHNQYETVTWKDGAETGRKYLPFTLPEFKLDWTVTVDDPNDNEPPEQVALNGMHNWWYEPQAVNAAGNLAVHYTAQCSIFNQNLPLGTSTTGGSYVWKGEAPYKPLLVVPTPAQFPEGSPDFEIMGLTNSDISWGNDWGDASLGLNYLGAIRFGEAQFDDHDDFIGYNPKAFQITRVSSAGFAIGKNSAGPLGPNNEEHWFAACWNGAFFDVFDGGDEDNSYWQINDQSEVFGLSTKLPQASRFDHADPAVKHPFWYSSPSVYDFYTVLPEPFRSHIGFVAEGNQSEECDPFSSPNGSMLFNAKIADTNASGAKIWRSGNLLWDRRPTGRFVEVKLPSDLSFGTAHHDRMNDNLIMVALQSRPVLDANGAPMMNGNLPVTTRRAILLVPVELKDLRSAGDEDDQIIESTLLVPKQNSGESAKDYGIRRSPYFQTQLPSQSIAYIEPHRGPNNSPDMPHLVARLPNAPSGLRVRWRLEVEYFRGNGYRADYVMDFTRPEDRILIPAAQNGEPAFTPEMDVSEEWRISESPTWVSEILSNGFFGGTGKLFVWPQGQQNPPADPFITFRIGGKNPDQQLARNYIDAVAGQQFWYAYAIARHETGTRVRENGQLRFYNQFYTSYQDGPIGDSSVDMGWAAWSKGWPLYNLDRGRRNNGTRYQNGPGGYGLYQLTWGPEAPDKAQGTGSNAFIPRRMIWNWQNNAIGAITELQGKATAAEALRVGLQAAYPLWPAIPNEGHLSGMESIVVTYYNETENLPSSDRNVNGAPRKTPWTAETRNGTRIWQFHQNSQDYVQKVNAKINNTTP